MILLPQAVNLFLFPNLLQRSNIWVSPTFGMLLYCVLVAHMWIQDHKI